MWQNPIRYVKPKTWTKEVITEELKETTRTTTNIVEDKLKNPDLKIPLCPYIHPQGVLDIIKLGGNHCSIAMFLCTNLNSKIQKNTVNISIDDIAEQCNLSVRTVKSIIGDLIDNGFIIKTGKQIYVVSPKLVWFGNQVDWAIQLDSLRFEENKKDSINYILA